MSEKTRKKPRFHVTPKHFLFLNLGSDYKQTHPLTEYPLDYIRPHLYISVNFCVRHGHCRVQKSLSVERWKTLNVNMPP